MLLSVREMGLGEDHEGILDLPADAPVGTAYAAWAGMDDPVIEIAVTPNRGDALSVRGVARDLAAAGLGTLVPFSPVPITATGPSAVQWRIDMPEACPWVLGRTVRGVKNGPSPQWLVDRLVSVGLRPINALVDMTNFFTLDIGRPLHVFDADKVAGGVLTFRPGAGERFRALNGKDYTARPEDCAIADANGVQSLAGVIGGAATGCDEGTTNVFIECALFDPVRVATTGRHHQIISDARQRFERGIDPALLPVALDAATAMVIGLCGGEASDLAAAGAEPAWPRTARMRFSRLAGLGGLDVPADQAAEALERLGFAIAARDAESVTVHVPSWRNDVANLTPLEPSPGLTPERLAVVAAGREAIEPECDLIEEVLRLRSLDAVPAVSLPRDGAIPPASLTPRQTRAALARRMLAAGGLSECVTFSFMDSRDAAVFGAVDAGLMLANPIAADLDRMRPTPVATLLLAAKRNAARGFGDVGLFEIGPAFPDHAPQQPVAAGLRLGSTPRHWDAPTRGVDAMDAKGDLWAMLIGLGVPIEALQITADAPVWYHPGQSGTVRQGPKTVLATFGALHPRVLADLGITGPAVAFELLLDAIAEPKRRKKGSADLPAFQPVRRDFAFLADSAVTADTVLRAARGAERALTAEVSLFDIYEGEKVQPGKKSIAIEVVFQPKDRTLTDAEIEAAGARVVAAVAKVTGAVLR
jgi:phenylalanyl-tRNA synthetase beta chain